jgi:hypothetical protein
MVSFFPNPDVSDADAMLLMLLASHAIADFGIQSAYVAEGKCRHSAAGRHHGNWFWILSAHAMMHAGLVALVTGSALLGLGEFIAQLDHRPDQGREQDHL